ncbi:hypothetical protein E3P96_01693 [Wallemia ichthyophaga]|nr:hypothetical protein E3P96_01693 [Wallemia ichthyophaga]
MQRRPLKEIPLRKIVRSSPLARSRPIEGIFQRTPNSFSEGALPSPRSPNPGAVSGSWTIFEEAEEDVGDNSVCNTPGTLSPQQDANFDHPQIDNEADSVADSETDDDSIAVVDENENPPSIGTFKSPMRRPPMISNQRISEDFDSINGLKNDETPTYKYTAAPQLTPQSASKAHGKRMLECEDEWDSPVASLHNSAAKRRRLLD